MRFEATEATRKGDLQRAAELQYGEIPKTEKELAELTAAGCERGGCEGWRKARRGC